MLFKALLSRGPEAGKSLGCSRRSKTSVAGDGGDGEGRGDEVLEAGRGWITLGPKVYGEDFILRGVGRT